MTERRSRYEVEFISGKVVKDLSYDEATKLFYSHAGSVVRPYGYAPYKAP